MSASGLVPVEFDMAEDSLALWVSSFEALANAASMIATTPFVPGSLRSFDERGTYDARTTAANIASAILAGHELHIPPMGALRSIDVVNGTPALRALALRAICQARGHHIWLTEATNTRAIVRGRRADAPESETQQITWTMDDAKARNLAGKTNWRVQPRNMLIARATSEVCRLIAADAILGLPYSIEELEDGDEIVEQSTAETTEQPVPRTAQRRPRRPLPPPRPALVETRVEDEPLTEEPPAVSPTEQPAAKGTITRDQKKALNAGFSDLDVTKREEKLEIVEHFLGYKVGSSNELTLEEASKVITELGLWKARQAEATAAAKRIFAEDPPPEEPPEEDDPLLDEGTMFEVEQ